VQIFQAYGLQVFKIVEILLKQYVLCNCSYWYSNTTLIWCYKHSSNVAKHRWNRSEKGSRKSLKSLNSPPKEEIVATLNKVHRFTQPKSCQQRRHASRDNRSWKMFDGRQPTFLHPHISRILCPIFTKFFVFTSLDVNKTVIRQFWRSRFSLTSIPRRLV